ncbi:MGMT family protein [Streptomyces specialis]|uniref:MGMT family protein n=1 Tax=Streptomyces specialis TaxID=498367 RepID=UPI002D21A741|nr:MGMT family protein [Streptomyces specialis]
MAGPTHSLPEYADRVLTMAEQIPPGRVLTYGDIAGLLGEGGPRQVGRALALYGGAVPWWRVVRADGKLLPGHERRALEHYRAEGTPLRAGAGPGDTPRLDLKRARWNGDAPGDGDGVASAGDGGGGAAAHRHQLPASSGAAAGRPSVRGTPGKGRATGADWRSVS